MPYWVRDVLTRSGFPDQLFYDIVYVCTQTGTATFCTSLAFGMELPLGDHGSDDWAYGHDGAELHRWLTFRPPGPLVQRPMPKAPPAWFPGCRRPLEWEPVAPLEPVPVTTPAAPAPAPLCPECGCRCFPWTCARFCSRCDTNIAVDSVVGLWRQRLSAAHTACAPQAACPAQH